METSLDPEPAQPIFVLLSVIDAPSYFIGSAVALLILLILSALISGSEVAFFSLSGTDLQDCASSKKASERLIYRLLQQPKKLLATILIFNNLVNVSFVTIFTFMIWKLASTKDPSNIYNIAAPFIITIIMVFIGEVIPKVYANQKGLNFATKTAYLLNIANKFFSPLSGLLLAVSNVIESRIETKGYELSVEDLHNAIEITTSADEETSQEEKEILRGIVNFGTISVTQIMHARIDVTAIENTINFHQLMDKINKTSFSRIPVFEETIDNIKGILYVKDILPFVKQDEKFKWQKLIREPYFIPESKKIDDLLRNFQEKHVHMAVVVDEYGGTSGIITLEDIIEEIVGEIVDEFDREEIDYQQISTNVYEFEGKTSLNDMIRILDLKPDEFDEARGESESIGGLLLELNSSMPNVGEQLQYEQFTFLIKAVNTKRIKRVRVEVGTKPEENED